MSSEQIYVYISLMGLADYGVIIVRVERALHLSMIIANGLTVSEIERMSSAFEHDDFKKALII